MPFALSKLSRQRLEGVHPALIAIVERAITLTTVDFRVQEGLRSSARQAELVQAGASQTLHSKHLSGRAVDLVALVGRSIRWDWPLYFPIAAAMREAAADLGTPLTWGGCWCDLRHVADPETALEHYAAAARAKGRRPFLDGPHFEIGPKTLA